MQYWAQMKAWTVRTPLADNETYSDRLEAACDRITPANCLGYVKHTKAFWLQCMNQTDIVGLNGCQKRVADASQDSSMSAVMLEPPQLHLPTELYVPNLDETGLYFA